MPLRFYTRVYTSLLYKPCSPKRFLLCSVVLFILALISYVAYISFIKLELWPGYPSVDLWCERETVPEYMLQPVSDEMTIVTMFLDLGLFKKGEEFFAYHSPYKYRRWMNTFGRLVNPVVAYVETDDDENYFRQIRSCLPSRLTKIIKIRREELSSFTHLSRVKEIYSQPSYPKHYPNTVYPEYSCSMNAKYDVLEMACTMDFFRTPLFAWLDIGLFRGQEEEHQDLFKLVAPSQFKPEKVAFSQAWSHAPHLSVKDIVMNKVVWVTGGMILATKQKMLELTKEYKGAVVDLLQKGLSNTDQEVLHAMYSHEMKAQRRVAIDTYHCQQGRYNLWGPDARYFCLGYVCKDAWEKRIARLKKQG